MTRTQARNARKRTLRRATQDAARNPGRLAHEAVATVGHETLADGSRVPARVRLDGNANRGKRGASPANWSRRTLAHETMRQTPAALIVSHPMRTPTGRLARRGGAVEYSSYTIGSALPQPVRKDG